MNVYGNGKKLQVDSSYLHFLSLTTAAYTYQLLVDLYHCCEGSPLMYYIC